jgi:hypothetical protein
MLKRVKQGRVVYIPASAGDSIVNVRAKESELRAVLSGLHSGIKRSLSNTLHAPITGALELPPIGGYGCNPTPRYYSSWCFEGKSAFRLVGEFCSPEGCKVEDKITSSATVDPAAKTSRVAYNSLYLPDNYDFTQIHFEWWVYCYRNLQPCGNANSPNFPGSSNGRFFPTSTKTLNGDKVAHALRFWGFFEPLQEWIGSPPDGPVRTGTATCDAKPVNTCVYD